MIHAAPHESSDQILLRNAIIVPIKNLPFWHSLTFSSGIFTPTPDGGENYPLIDWIMEARGSHRASPSRHPRGDATASKMRAVGGSKLPASTTLHHRARRGSGDATGSHDSLLIVAGVEMHSLPEAESVIDYRANQRSGFLNATSLYWHLRERQSHYPESYAWQGTPPTLCHGTKFVDYLMHAYARTPRCVCAET